MRSPALLQAASICGYGRCGICLRGHEPWGDGITPISPIRNQSLRKAICFAQDFTFTDLMASGFELPFLTQKPSILSLSHSLVFLFFVFL